ncbi:MAG: N-acetylneuraminate synthase family protein [bacterium]|nr:N-acetylneuraminate synthase family protein [bacterium]
MVARSGADAIKIQIVNAEQSYAHDSESYAIFKKVELPLEAWERVVARARELRLDIFASFAHPDDVALVERFNFPAVKVSSSNITNFPLLRAVAATGRPIILSTGLAYMSEVDEAVRYLESEGSGPIALLHCTALYPTPPERVNLRAMDTLGRAFPYPVGLSDHTRGATCAIAAVALGARIIEKHVTLDRNLPGPDHAFSATPDELALLVRGVREVVMALGSPVKEPVPEEVSLRQKFQRTIVAARDIHPGEVLTYENLAAKRCPHPGLAPKHLDVLIGRKVTRMIVRDAPVSFDIL